MQHYIRVWLMLFSGWVIIYLIRVSLSPILPTLIGELSLTHGEAGLLANAYFYAYTAMQLPAGYLGERLGRKRILIIACIFWSITSYWTSIARGFAELFAARLASGIVHGFYFGNDRPLLTVVTPRKRLGVGQGVTFSGLGTGLGVGMVLSGWVSELMGWRAVFQILAIPPLIMAAVFALFLHEPPRIGSETTEVNRSALLTRRELWLFYIGGIPMVYALWVAAIWMPTILAEYGVESVAFSSIISSLVGLAGIPGLIAAGLISDWAWKHGVARGYVAASFAALAALTAATLGYAITVKTPLYQITLLVAALGAFIWAVWSPLFAALSHHVEEQMLGTAFGMMNGIHFIGSLISPYLTGMIRDATGTFSWGLYLTAILTTITIATFSLEARTETRKHAV